MDSWENLYASGKFSITTDSPSRIVKAYLARSKLNQRVADLGCGNGRNSAYAALLGYFVDAVDVSSAGAGVRLDGKIRFHNESMLTFGIKPDFYDAVIMTRVIQYVSPAELEVLINRVSRGLRLDGLLLMNYTASGGILDIKQLNVEKYKHPISSVKNLLLSSGLSITCLEKGASRTTNTSYDVQVESYDIAAKKRIK